LIFLFKFSHKKFQTRLSRQIIMAAYDYIPFYNKLIGHTEPLGDTEYSPNGKYIVTASRDYTAIIWDRLGGLKTILKGHKGQLIYEEESAKFSPDSKYILSASNDFIVRVMPVSIETVFKKINKEKICGEVYKLSETEKKIFGIK